MAELFTKLSPVKIRKPSTCSSKFLNNFVEKAFVLNNGHNAIYSTIISMLAVRLECEIALSE